MIVGVIGAGTMGAAIAALFANAGYRVVLVDVSEGALRRAKERHEGEILRELDEANLRKRENIVELIEYTTKLEDVGECGFVVEAIVEKLDAKRELVKALEGIVGEECIIATNTSSFMPSEIAEVMRKRERHTLFHFSNPPILRTIVEIGGSMVSEKYLQKTAEIVRNIGKEPIILKKDSRGHIFNRFLCAALSAVSWDIAKFKPQQVDAAMKNLGSPSGFYELLDYIGIDVLLAVQDSMTEAHGNRFKLSNGMRWLLEKMIEWGKLGKKSGEGFYIWRSGKAEMPEAEAADITSMIAAAVNEAFRILEDELADKETINRAYILATGAPAGILDVAEMFGYGNILETLERKYEETRAEVFKPCNLIRDSVSV